MTKRTPVRNDSYNCEVDAFADKVMLKGRVKRLWTNAGLYKVA
jgi:hypothetical protein